MVAIASYIRDHKFEGMLVIVLAAVAFESTCAPTIDSSVIPNLDKIIHFFVFGGIAWLLAGVVDNQAWFGRAYITIAILSVVTVALLGAGDEYLQTFTPTRHAELNDVLADMMGGVFFLVVWVALKMNVKKCV